MTDGRVSTTCSALSTTGGATAEKGGEEGAAEEGAAEEGAAEEGSQESATRPDRPEPAQGSFLPRRCWRRPGCRAQHWGLGLDRAGGRRAQRTLFFLPKKHHHRAPAPAAARSPVPVQSRYAMTMPRTKEWNFRTLLTFVNLHREIPFRIPRPTSDRTAYFLSLAALSAAQASRSS